MRWTEWVLFAYAVVLTVVGLVWGYLLEAPFRVPWQTATLSLVMGGLALGYITHAEERRKAPRHPAERHVSSS